MVKLETKLQKLIKYPKIQMKKNSKVLLENLRIGLNVCDRQKFSTKNNKKIIQQSYAAAFTFFIMIFALT